MTMSIQTIPNTQQNAVAAEATPQPRHIWYDGDVIRIYTGVDIPVDEA